MSVCMGEVGKVHSFHANRCQVFEVMIWIVIICKTEVRFLPTPSIPYIHLILKPSLKSNY